MLGMGDVGSRSRRLDIELASAGETRFNKVFKGLDTTHFEFSANRAYLLMAYVPTHGGLL
jgi:hypothetical protein